MSPLPRKQESTSYLPGGGGGGQARGRLQGRPARARALRRAAPRAPRRRPARARGARQKCACVLSHTASSSPRQWRRLCRATWPLSNDPAGHDARGTPSIASACRGRAPRKRRSHARARARPPRACTSTAGPRAPRMRHPVPAPGGVARRRRARRAAPAAPPCWPRSPATAARRPRRTAASRRGPRGPPAGCCRRPGTEPGGARACACVCTCACGVSGLSGGGCSTGARCRGRSSAGAAGAAAPHAARAARAPPRSATAAAPRP